MAPPLAAKLSFTSSPDGKALVHIDAAPPEARRQSQVQGPDVVTGVKIDDDTAVTRLQAKQRGKTRVCADDIAQALKSYYFPWISFSM